MYLFLDFVRIFSFVLFCFARNWPMTKYKLFNLILKFTQRHVCACALSRLHCCNSFLSGCSRFLLSRLQKVQNSAAKLIFKARKHDYVQPLLQALRWLPVQARIDYNMSTVCHKPFSGSSPAFFSLSWSSHCVGPFKAASSFCRHMDSSYPHVTTKTFWQICFSYCAPKQWRSLSSDIRHIQSFHAS